MPFDVCRGRENVLFAACSPDGTLVLTTVADRTAKIWNSTTGECLLLLAGHVGAGNSAAFSTDGALVVTASANRTAKVWDAATGECLLPFAGHEECVCVCVCTPLRSCPMALWS